MRLFYLFVVAGFACLTGCAGVAPVPGGTDSVNAAYYASQDDFKARVGRLQAGMPEALVMEILGRGAPDLTQLSRIEILNTLYGTNTMQVVGSTAQRDEMVAYLQSLYGYKLEYKDVAKRHGFVNPLRIRTEEQGFAYTVNLIFRQGVLLEKPDLAGGVVHDTSSSTVFDYLNPGTVLGRVP